MPLLSVWVTGALLRNDQDGQLGVPALGVQATQWWPQGTGGQPSSKVRVRVLPNVCVVSYWFVLHFACQQKRLAAHVFRLGV